MAVRCSPEALEKSEIVTSILQHGHRQTIKSAIIVSRLWFECAFPIAWVFKAATKLASVENAERRQMYASEIKHLNRDTADFLHYLKPTVTSLELGAVGWDDNDFKIAADFAGQLKDTYFHEVGLRASPSAIGNFLASCTSLESANLALLGRDLDFDKAEYFVALANLPHLKFLAGVSYLKPETLRPMVQPVPEPFVSLCYLSSAASAAAIPMVFMIARNITELDLYVQDGEPAEMQGISNLERLRKLYFQVGSLSILTK
ncbi:hypothetical protein PWT90_05217 [Aphanocladium album]|nr:hypothetical protein PWT90_05217 [Aphanocladium album]